MARAMETPLYQLFYDGNEHPANLSEGNSDTTWGDSGRNRRDFARFRGLLNRMNENDRELLLSMAQKMAMQTKAGRKAKN
jgi:hypothetical protein